ncbi:MAG TPA: site-specific integrase [Acidimicrobiales bacterium]|nr:site-specific integrase [Acidimicrobiales bacterium]
MAETTRRRRRKGRRTFGATRQLPSGRWQASYLAPDGTRRVAPETFAEAADAAAWLRQAESSISKGTWRPPELASETFGSYGARWLTQRPDLRPRTHELYALLWRRWLEPDLGPVKLSTMSPESWRAWWATTRAAHPGSTQPDKAYRLARAMLNQAVDDGILAANPCRVKGAGREHAAERPVVMPDQVARIAEAIDGRYRAMVLLAAYGSLRFGELAGLRRDRVDLLHRTVRIDQQAVELADGRVIFGEPKSEAGRRSVAIPDELAGVLDGHLLDHVGPEPNALVFTSPEGHPLRRTKFRSRWRAACEAAGISGLRFHDLRGSGATWAATTGATVSELMSRLGHATPTVAMRYQHATTERDQAIAERLGALMRAAGEMPRPDAAPVVRIDH